MANYEYTNTNSQPMDAPLPGVVTLTFDREERQLLLMALGELLASVSREEHLTPALQQLIAKVQAAPSRT